ncbi:MAG: type II toxin-antitoxin system VapC family toxin [Desulfobacula sp.]|nr:type II toxin-antitoxin system VapC family toxin [Desulfobacula sp.]
MIYLDTHVLVWLYAGDLKKISKPAQRLINKNEIYICPIVRLELQYLFEIGRITIESKEIIIDLSGRIGLKICDKNFNIIVSGALDLSWTRDPFDRIIVANAALNNNILLTKDQNILKNYENARW